MDLFDFSNNKKSDIYYGGSEKKLGILINGEKYMLKFPKKTLFGKRNNVISEYIGSHVFNMCGVRSQETFLGYYLGELVVACKDFVNDGYEFVAFNDVGESTIDEDKEKYQYSYDDIVDLLILNKKITNLSNVISTFFEIYILDALLGNFDRHGANWGFLKKNNLYELSPVFDNGSCLFPSLIDEKEMEEIIGSQQEIDKRVFDFPTSQLRLNNNKSSYYEVISSMAFPYINEALVKLFPKINLDEICVFVKNINCLSKIHKVFYITMIKERYNKILKNTYLKLRINKNENL